VTRQIVRLGHTTDAGKQGCSYIEGIAKQTVGSEGICTHLLTIPPGGRAKAYMHAGAPHPPATLSDKPASAVIACTDLNEQESVVLLPELDALVDFSRTAA
jgi:uncharacterized RmlC-like cupin family protein